MRHSIRAVVLLVTVATVSAQQAPPMWFPPPVQDAVVEQLVQRLREIKLPWTEERLVGAARVTVATIQARLDEWREPTILQRAPALAHLQLPQSGDQRLDAMVRYHVCTAVGFIRHERREKEANEQARIAAAVGMTAGSMILLYLREGHLRAGGTGEQVEQRLTSPTLQPALDRLQSNPADIAAADKECVAVFGDVTG